MTQPTGEAALFLMLGLIAHLENEGVLDDESTRDLLEHAIGSAKEMGTTACVELLRDVLAPGIVAPELQEKLTA